ncbi:MAG TPA: lamin tail domain-containing protein, partial [bacterium]|nr:lamin tail domain-containing protein [bacterium]
MKKFLFLFIINFLFFQYLYSASFAIISIDASKESSWTATPDTDAETIKDPGSGTFGIYDLWVTNDTQYLYIGCYTDGDPWNDGLSAHFGVYIDTNGTASGAGSGNSPYWGSHSEADPNGTNLKPDFLLMWWISYGSTQIGGAVRRTWTSSWSNEVSLSIGTDISRGADKWTEMRIPLSYLGITQSMTIKILVWGSPDENKPAASTSCPADPNFCTDWGNTGASDASKYLSYRVKSWCVINEVLFNARGTDRDDFIELYNPTSYYIGIENYTLRDVEANKTYSFPAGTTMSPGEFILVHPPYVGTNYTDWMGIRHFYPSSGNTWYIGNSGTTSDENFALELFNSTTQTVSTIIDFVAASDAGELANTVDDTAVNAGIWTGGDSINVYNGSTNTDRAVYLKSDGVDENSSSNWGQIGTNKGNSPGITNKAAGGPSTISSVAFKASDFSADKSCYIAGETIYILVTATQTSATNTEATFVELPQNSNDNMDVVCYENGVNSNNFRGVIRTQLGSVAAYSSAEDSITLPNYMILTMNSKTTTTCTDWVYIDTYPYLSYSSYNHKTKELYLYFTRPVSYSSITPANITIQTTSSGGSSQSLSGATVTSSSDSYGIKITLTDAQRNTIAGWEVSPLYIAWATSIGSATSTLAIPTILTTSAKQIDYYVTGYDTAVKINEVCMWGSAGDSDWIELYFLNDVANGWINLNGWYIAERTSSRNVTINQNIKLGPGDFFVIYASSSGTNDTAMTAGVSDTGWWRAGTNFFYHTTYNQVALFNSTTTNSSTIVDYITWVRTGSSWSSMTEITYAVDAGIWPNNTTYFSSYPNAGEGSLTSIGLIIDGGDSNVTSDWQYFATSTPNASNSANNAPTVTASNILITSGYDTFFGGKTYKIRITYSDQQGASDIERMDMRITNNSDSIWAYTIRPSASANATIVTGNAYVVGNITVDTSYSGNDVQCTWTMTFDWDWTEANNYYISGRATDDNPETGNWTDSTVTYTYENDLILAGTLTNNANITNGSWVKASQSVTWSGLTVYYEGTVISPDNTDFDIRLTTSSGNTDQTTGAALNQAVSTR